jgi:hypothetical protein
MRRALARTLFEESSFRHGATGGDAPALNVEVLTFEEVQTARHGARRGASR